MVFTTLKKEQQLFVAFLEQICPSQCGELIQNPLGFHQTLCASLRFCKILMLTNKNNIKNIPSGCKKVTIQSNLGQSSHPEAGALSQPYMLTAQLLSWASPGASSCTKKPQQHYWVLTTSAFSHISMGACLLTAWLVKEVTYKPV